jgi:protein TonB
MNFARVGLAGLLAAAVTFGLFALMQGLIAMNLTMPEEGEEKKIVDIFMVEATIETKFDTAKPDKPEEAEAPPPEMEIPEFDTPDINPDAMNMAAPKISTQISSGTLGGFNTDGDFLPIVKVAAKYPRNALNKGIEGFCTVRYTVTATGTTKDVIVLPEKCMKASGDLTSMFNRASVKAAQKFKYKPRVIDGTAVEVPNMHNKFTYKLGKK